MGIHNDRDWCMCFTMILVNNQYNRHCSFASSWPEGHLCPWIHRGKWKVKRHILAPKIYEPDNKKHIMQHSLHLSDKTWLNIHIVHSFWQLKCGSYTPLSWLFGIQSRSTRIFQKPHKWISYYSSASNTSCLCLTCWTWQSWPCQQLLVILHVPYNHQWTIHSQPTMQCLPPNVVMQ